MKKIIVIILILNAVLYAKPTMSQKNYDLLMSAEKLIELDDVKKAKEILNKLVLSKNDYAKSYAYQYLANLSLQTADYNKTKTYYETIIKLAALDENNIDRIKFSLSKIYLSLEEYDKCIILSKELLNNKNDLTLDLYESLIYAYYYKKEFKKSIVYSKKYNALSKEKKENIYQMLYSSHIELKKYAQAITTLNTMVKKWTQKQNYWLQLISLYQETKQYKKALATIELSYKEKILDPKKNTQFYVNLLLQNDLFQKGSLAIEQGINKGYIKKDARSFELLISAYLSAKEVDKAIKKLSTSKFAKTNKYKKILANLHYNNHHYKSTIKVLKSIAQKTKKEFDADVHILFALCYFELEDIKNTTLHLKKVYHSKKKKRAVEIAKVLQIKL